MFAVRLSCRKVTFVNLENRTNVAISFIQSHNLKIHKKINNQNVDASNAQLTGYNS